MAGAILTAIRDVSSMGDDFAAGPIKSDCIWLSRKVSLLSHLVKEIRDFVGKGSEASSSAALILPGSCLGRLLQALEAAKRFLLLGVQREGAWNNVSLFLLVACNLYSLRHSVEQLDWIESVTVRLANFAWTR